MQKNATPHFNMQCMLYKHCIAFHTELIFSALIAACTGLHATYSSVWRCISLKKTKIFDFHSENLIDFVFTWENKSLQNHLLLGHLADFEIIFKVD